MAQLDNRAYYDDFAGWYENERHLPYHRMLDDLEVELVERYAPARRCSRSAAAPVATRGIRVITPITRVLEVPVLGAAVRWAEHRLADLPGARDVGGFLVACCRRR